MTLAVAGGVLGLLLGPWLAVTTVRLAARDDAARAGARRTSLTCLVAAAVLATAPTLTTVRPALVALAWFGGAAVVLAGVDLAVHRLPDRVSYPAAAVCAGALVVDAAVTGDWAAPLRGAVAGAVVWLAGTGLQLISPAGLGGGDVKLLGLLGLVLGWAGWGVLLSGLFLGLLIGAGAALALMAVGRANWRTPIAFGPPLLAGGWIALLLAAPLPVA